MALIVGGTEPGIFWRAFLLSSMNPQTTENADSRTLTTQSWIKEKFTILPWIDDRNHSISGGNVTKSIIPIILGMYCKHFLTTSSILVDWTYREMAGFAFDLQTIHDQAEQKAFLGLLYALLILNSEFKFVDQWTVSKIYCTNLPSRWTKSNGVGLRSGKFVFTMSRAVEPQEARSISFMKFLYKH